MIGFIAPITLTHFGTSGHYSTTVILHTFQFAVAPALGLSFLTSRILATNISVSLKLQLTREDFLSVSNSFLAISYNSRSAATSRTGRNSRLQLTLLLTTLSLLLYTPSPLQTVSSCNSSARISWKHCPPLSTMHVYWSVT
jgi:hypothetical protein